MHLFFAHVSSHVLRGSTWRTPSDFGRLRSKIKAKKNKTKQLPTDERGTGPCKSEWKILFKSIAISSGKNKNVGQHPANTK
jgi:hypothetical protein